MIPYAFALLNRSMNLGYLSKMAEQVVIVLIPPLALIFLVLGTIFLGIATPTEGGAMGATGALIMSLMKGRLDRKTLLQALDSTAKLATFVMFILIGARVFALTFYGISGDRWVEELLLALPGGEVGFLITVSIVVFILGCFLDFFEIAFIMVPLLAPVAEKLGIDLIWFGVLLGFNLQASFLTPPFGFALFYLRSVAPIKAWYDKTTDRMIEPISTRAIYTGTLPFIVIQIVMLGILIAFPGLVTHYKTETGDHEPGRHQRGDQQHRRRRIWPAGLGSQPRWWPQPAWLSEPWRARKRHAGDAKLRRAARSGRSGRSSCAWRLACSGRSDRFAELRLMETHQPRG
jgi:TRAP-type mannitol/chloroaromatic compound transport system permease large subunit